MTTEHLLRTSFEIAVASDDFGARFYDRLLAEHPALRPLFTRHSSGAQHKMFAQKLAAIIDAISDPATLEAQVREVARTHREYGVSPEMYRHVGVVLIATLRDCLADEWTDEIATAWTQAYATVERMLVTAPP